jgi:hypothetical protein
MEIFQLPSDREDEREELEHDIDEHTQPLKLKGPSWVGTT